MRTLPSCLLYLRDYSDPLSDDFFYISIVITYYVPTFAAVRLRVSDFRGPVFASGRPWSKIPLMEWRHIVRKLHSGIRTQKVEIVWIKIWNVVCVLVADNVKNTARDLKSRYGY